MLAPFSRNGGSDAAVFRYGRDSRTEIVLAVVSAANQRAALANAVLSLPNLRLRPIRSMSIGRRSPENGREIARNSTPM